MVKGRDPRLTRAYKKQRLVVLARDGYTCAYCGQDADQVVAPVLIEACADAQVNPRNF